MFYCSTTTQQQIQERADVLEWIERWEAMYEVLDNPLWLLIDAVLNLLCTIFHVFIVKLDMFHNINSMSCESSYRKDRIGF